MLKGWYCLSQTRTGSPSAIGHFSSVAHFFLLFNCGRSSFFSLSHIFFMNWLCAQEAFLMAADPSTSTTFGMKWLGVSASKSVASLLDDVRGLLLSNCSTEQTIVVRCYSFSDWEPGILRIVTLRDLTRHSHAPPKCGASGGLNVQLIPNLVASYSKSSPFKVENSSRNSRAAPTTVLPLSGTMVFEHRRLAINLWMVFKQPCMSRDHTILRLTALVLRHVNRQIHLFTDFGSVLTGIAQSDPLQ